MRQKLRFPSLLALISVASASVAHGQLLRYNSVLDSLQSITASTIPANGDVNPYGVAFVPAGFPTGPNVAPGDVLIANFNNSSNLQGTGTTIVSISPTGQQALFATSTLIGLDTALGVLSRGFVVVGNLPVTYPGGSATPHQGSLQVFDRNGNLVSTINDANLLDSPWDLTINDQGSQAQVFVSNVLSGTVTRVNLSVSTTGVSVSSKTRIGSGFTHAPNAAAVVVGPTGLAFDANHDTVFIASTADNKIYGISSAITRTTDDGTGYLAFSSPGHLHGPLGLTLASNGNLITANGDAVFAGGTQNALVEFTQQGSLVAQYQIDAGAPGGAFGLASTISLASLRFAAVDDDLNTVTIWTIPTGF